MTLLALPTGENVLMTAYRAVTMSEPMNVESFTAEYENIFGGAVLAAQPASTVVYDRFCMVDPTVQTVVQFNAQG